MGEVRKHLRIHGHVQGVSFRYYALQRAAALGLRGWVRNCPDGSVEAVVEGDADAVRAFIGWAQHGPSAAEVQAVQIEDETPVGEASFAIRG